MVDLHRLLYEQLSPHGATLVGPFVPHITVGRLATDTAADAAAVELAPTFFGGATSVTAVSLYEIDHRDTRAVIPLKAPNH